MGPTSSWLILSYRSHLISRETRNSDVVLSFENDLDVFCLETRCASKLREPAGSNKDVVYEVVHQR